MTAYLVRSLGSLLVVFGHYFFSRFIYWFICFWLQWVFIAAPGFSLVAVSRGAIPCCDAWDSHCSSFSCGTDHGPGAQAQQLWCMGLGGLEHVGSSWTKDQTHVLCIGRWVLNHWPTREVHYWTYLIQSPVYHHKFLMEYRPKWAKNKNFPQTQTKHLSWQLAPPFVQSSTQIC